ncbi:MAG TPA: YihY/virulence factor BrkB family protein [Chthoniobacterales bacterium]|nr:YihY/virulence factor BrkB family protein [Chthoniobacterales bacterium]
MHATSAESESRAQGWRGAWRLIKTTFTEWWHDDTFRYAASLAFYTIFSLAPVLLIAVGVASFFFARDVATEKIVAEVQRMVGSEGARAVHQVLDASKGFGKSLWAIAAGLTTFLLGATAVFAELQIALNRVWDVRAQPRRGVILTFLLDRLRSFALALGVGFLLLVSLVISAALALLQDYLNQWMPGVPVIWQTLNILASFAIAAILFAMIYKYLPDVEITWNDVAIGAVVTAALFTGGKYLIGLYLGQTAVATAFGAAGSFAVLLIWIYYSALISFFGAEFTQVYARLYGSRIQPSRHAVRVGEKTDAVPA